MKPILVAALIALAAGPAAAGNLLVNPDFDTDTSGWSPSNANPSLVQVLFDPDFDVDFLASSGSAEVQSFQVDPAGPMAKGPSMIQCVPVTPDTEYYASGWAYTPSGQSRTALPDLTVLFFTDASCTTPVGANVESNQGTVDVDTWQLLELLATAPPSAGSARLFARPRKQEAGGEVDVLFDALFLPEPGSGLSGLAAAGALSALAARRRG
jgi:hypothetical protein